MAQSHTLVEQILCEGPLSASAAAKLPIVPRTRGGDPRPELIVRWHRKGVLLADRTRVRLEAIRSAGKLLTSRAAIVRFIEAQQAGPPTAEPPRSPAARSAAAAAAERELQAAGA